MQIQPYDQPNVEQAKIVAKQMMNAYQEKGKLPELVSAFEEKDIKVYGALKSNSTDTVLESFLSDCNSGKSYVAIQAYLNPTKETTEALQRLRTLIQKKYKVATTLGFGPRFLHSTGQLHKGDAGNGLFIQFTSSIEEDLPIPENPEEEKTSITFGILIKAQALGDRGLRAGASGALQGPAGRHLRRGCHLFVLSGQESGRHRRCGRCHNQ